MGNSQTHETIDEEELINKTLDKISAQLLYKKNDIAEKEAKELTDLLMKSKIASNKIEIEGLIFEEKNELLNMKMKFREVLNEIISEGLKMDDKKKN